MTDLYVKAIELVVLAIVCVITRYVIPFIKTKISTEQMLVLLSYVDEFVLGAENIVSGKGLGDQKLSFVTTQVTDLANSLGLKLTDAQVRSIIEAAVKKMNEESK